MTHNHGGLAPLRRMLILLAVFALGLGSIAIKQSSIAEAATSVKVTPNTPNGWIFADDTDSGGSGGFVIGPGTPPLGTGSAHMLTDPNEAKIIFNTSYNGSYFNTITKLTYHSYRSSNDLDNNLAISLQFNLDYNLTDANTSWQGRLIYEPHLAAAGTLLQNQWQSWDTLTGKWWFSDPQGSTPEFCPRSDPCSWSYITTTWPNAGINSVWGAVLFKTGTWSQAFDGNIDAFTIATSAAETSYDFEYEDELACTTDCYVNALFGDNSYGGASLERAKKTIQAGLDQVSASGTVHVSAGNYAEAVSITKNGVTLLGAGAGINPLQHTILKGPIAGQSGIVLGSNITGISIKNLRVEGFNNGGICSGSSNNNNLTIDSVQVVANTDGNCLGGIHIRGPVSDVSINNVLADQNASRGIVIWNGYKQRITITNNIVTRNNCCGIELQDGTASGVTITGNTVTNNLDSGIAVIGLMAGAGPNLIANNTLSNNGRFGIEVKLPNGTGTESGDGSIVVRDNAVRLPEPIETLRPTEERDLGGIVVIRRGYVIGNNNADIPSGVVVKNNTVIGYKQNNLNSDSEGFGIVVEGYKMSVYGNTISDNDIGIQRQAGHLPYTANEITDGDQSDLPDNYFGRGNSPHTCALIGTNTFSNNGINTRDVTPTCDVASSLQFSTQPGNGQSGSLLSPQPVIEVLDAQGNIDTTYNGPILLAISNNPTNGTLGGTTLVSAVNGVATFSNLTIDKVGVGYTLVASLGSLPTVTSTAFTITHGPATHVIFSTQPGNAQAGLPLNPQPAVTLLDAYDNIVTDYSGNVLLMLITNPGGGTLNGNVSVKAINGIATFTNLSISQAGAGYKLLASATEISTAISAAFDITSATPTQLSFSTQPGSAIAGSPLNPQPVVSVLDAQGNVVTSYTGAVSLALGNNPSTARLSGTLMVNVVNGVATFSGLSLSKAGLDYTLIATASGLNSATSLPFDITPQTTSGYKLYLPLIVKR